MAKPRNYKAEYQKYGKPKKARQERSSRNKARRLMEKAGKVHKGDGRDVDHINFNPMNDRRSNLRVTSKKFNRGRKPPGYRSHKGR